MNFICAANWKMNLSFKEAEEFLNQFLEKTKDLKSTASSNKSNIGLKSDFCIFPQSIHGSLFTKHKNLNWGAQDFFFESSGAYTGQNSPDLFKELGANVMLIGHSERRTLFHETEASISKKIKKCIELNLIPMLCVGETLEQRKSNKTLGVIKDQLKSAYLSDSITESHRSDFSEDLSHKKSGKNTAQTLAKNLIIAYEPVWAIGTGLTAQPQDVKEVHDFIKSQVGEDTHVLYGGSVKPENAKELSMIPSVNGFLIGGASLKVDTFLSIYQNSVNN